MKKRFYPTPEDIAYLEQNYPTKPTEEIAKHFGISISAVYGLCNVRGIHKDKEYKRELNTKLALAAGKNTRFYKGMVPANKGKKMSKEVYQKVSRTMFKKGHKPSNILYDGAERLRHEKSGNVYVYIRVAPMKWIPKHKYIWEKANGPVPRGYVIRFKDDNSMNVTLDNLELVDKKDFAVMNKFGIKSKDLAQLIRANTQLKNTINQ